MNLFKILIPKENSQEITEIESFSVSWRVKTGWSNETEENVKVFIDKTEAEQFEKQLIESAKFIGAYICTDLKRN